jgi:glycogen debranching enzyme
VNAQDPLWQQAISVLRENDLGSWTRPAPRLYPHQWSWDSAFIAIGLAHIDPARALAELTSLLRGQWRDGRIPQIVYNPDVPADAYFPDAERWNCVACCPFASTDPVTSGIVQPPVHALALARVLELSSERSELREEIAAVADGFLAWHRYLADKRDPDGCGLLTIYHPWESGTDNSPRWDAVLERVTVGPVRPYRRRDLVHVADASQRPSNAEYDCYVWLMQSLEACGYDDIAVHQRHPFLVKDVLFSAIFAAANRALAWVFQSLELDDTAVAELSQLVQRFSTGVQGAWDASSSLVLDQDVRTGQPIRVTTWAGLSALLLPEVSENILEGSAERLASSDFAGNALLAYPVVPSTVPGSVGFREATYWRGPSWPIANHLLWQGLRGHGRAAAADSLRSAYLEMLRQPEAECAEYFHPFTGAPLGSRRQSWTAAVVIDWLAQDSS